MYRLLISSLSYDKPQVTGQVKATKSLPQICNTQTRFLGHQPRGRGVQSEFLRSAFRNNNISSDIEFCRCSICHFWEYFEKLIFLLKKFTKNLYRLTVLKGQPTSHFLKPSWRGEPFDLRQKRRKRKPNAKNFPRPTTHRPTELFS